MTQLTTLTIDIDHYWHAGTGRGSGSHLDALIDVDDLGLPFVSGKMLKGLLRDAVYRLESWGHFNDPSHPLYYSEGSLTEYIFGSRGTLDGNVSRDFTEKGKLRVGNAQLPEDFRGWITSLKQTETLMSANDAEVGAKLLPSYLDSLKVALYSTAIDHKTGVAKQASLRGMQVTIPMQLVAELDWLPSEQPYPWQDLISHALPLIRAVGGHRSRGFGRACVQLQTRTEEAA